jgi:hypothetical protein
LRIVRDFRDADLGPGQLTALEAELQSQGNVDHLVKASFVNIRRQPHREARPRWSDTLAN